MPYATYLNEDDRRKEQIKLHYKPYLRSLEKKALDFHTELKKEYDGKKWDRTKESNLQLFYILSETFWDVVIGILFSDFSCIIGSIIMVLIILIAHTRSLCLGVMG